MRPDMAGIARSSRPQGDTTFHAKTLRLRGARQEAAQEDIPALWQYY